MAEQDADNSSDSIKNQDNIGSNANSEEENGPSNAQFENSKTKSENESLSLGNFFPCNETPSKKEENPFSFKKFLNQDHSQKNKGARKKVFVPSNVSCSKLDMSSYGSNRSEVDKSSRVVNSTDVSSVLPDFVQDHLVIEQCYLSGSPPSIDFDIFNLQNLPDLNLEHQNSAYPLDSDRSNKHSTQYSNTLPDFTLGVKNFKSVNQNSSTSKKLPDFTLDVRPSADLDLQSVNENNDSFTSRPSRRQNNKHDSVDTSQLNRHREQISLSPSVPFDPPVNGNDLNPNVPIFFDLMIPAEERNGSGSNRGIAAPEAVSKSLPDFLSDGPIKKEIDENLQNIRGTNSLAHNGIPFSEHSNWSEQERLIREVELLRRQVMEKNRRLEILESELEQLHNTDQRETASLEFAFREVENNLKQTTKRAVIAEDLVLKLKQENKLLKSEICSLRSENTELRLGNYESQMLPSEEKKNQLIAKELRTAANIAENSLRSLLGGIENLRVIASSLENTHKAHENTEDYPAFLQEDSASGPAL